MTGTIMQFILLLIAHAAAGIYSSTLKYSKKITYIVWGIWGALQIALLFYTDFVLTNAAVQFLVGFVPSGALSGFKNHAMLTGSGSWSVPSGVEKIRITGKVETFFFTNL